MSKADRRSSSPTTTPKRSARPPRSNVTGACSARPESPTLHLSHEPHSGPYSVRDSALPPSRGTQQVKLCRLFLCTSCCANCDPRNAIQTPANGTADGVRIRRVKNPTRLDKSQRSLDTSTPQEVN